MKEHYPFIFSHGAPPDTISPQAAEGEILKKFFIEMLPNLDQFYRLHQIITENGEVQWQQGMNLLYQKLYDFFQDKGFTRTAHVNSIYDPSLHRIIETVHSCDRRQGTICEIIREGWKYRDEVLRYAEVVVSD